MMIVEQFGLAMMPLCQAMSSGLTSGTTSGTLGSMRNVLELSMTMQPRLAASGPNSLLIEPPANKPMSTPSKDSGLASSTVYSSPLTVIFLPAERYDANNFNLLYGNFRSSIKRINSWPTAPVAPKIATTGSFVITNFLP